VKDVSQLLLKNTIPLIKKKSTLQSSHYRNGYPGNWLQILGGPWSTLWEPLSQNTWIFRDNAVAYQPTNKLYSRILAVKIELNQMKMQW